MSDNSRALGTFVRGVREKLGLTQTELATRCAVSSTHISLIEQGKRLPGDDLCVTLAEVLQCRPAEILRRAHTAKSPSAAAVLYEQDHATAQAEPDDVRLRRFLEDLGELKQILPSERYDKLLDMLLVVVEPYKPASLRGSTTNVSPPRPSSRRPRSGRGR